MSKSPEFESLSWDASSEPADADVKIVGDGLTAYNLQAGDISQVRKLAVFARDGSEVVAGLLGRTWGECCEVLQVWVRDDLRKHGIGRELMMRAEAEAVSRACSVIYLDTFSFQAPGFYEALGFESLHVIQGFPNGFKKHHMKKQLKSRPFSAESPS